MPAALNTVHGTRQSTARAGMQAQWGTVLEETTTSEWMCVHQPVTLHAAGRGGAWPGPDKSSAVNQESRPLKPMCWLHHLPDKITLPEPTPAQLKPSLGRAVNLAWPTALLLEAGSHAVLTQVTMQMVKEGRKAGGDTSDESNPGRQGAKRDGCDEHAHVMHTALMIVQHTADSAPNNPRVVLNRERPVLSSLPSGTASETEHPPHAVGTISGRHSAAAAKAAAAAAAVPLATGTATAPRGRASTSRQVGKPDAGLTAAPPATACALCPSGGATVGCLRLRQIHHLTPHRMPPRTPPAPPLLPLLPPTPLPLLPSPLLLLQ